MVDLCYNSGVGLFNYVFIAYMLYKVNRNNQLSQASLRKDTKIRTLLKISLLSFLLAGFTSGLTNAQSHLVGDLKSDYTVDLKDLRILSWQWLDPGCLIYDCSGNLDGVDGVNMTAFALLAKSGDVVNPHIIISEFVAGNASSEPLENGELLDGDGRSSDWIELYNPTDTSISLDGWYLTNDKDDLTMWQFPDGLVVWPGRFLIIFASEKNQELYPYNYPYLDPSGYYHTNFNLNI